MTTATARPSRRHHLGLLLCRVVVPLWILSGAFFKLRAANPGLLPKNILTLADQLGANLDILLATLIALEFFAAAVILCLGRYARAMAIFMMSVFCVVLIAEIAAGNANCGCLGAHSPSPWVMLAIDGTMLLGLIFLTPPGRTRGATNALALAAAAVLTGTGIAVTVLMLQPARSAPVIAQTPPARMRAPDPTPAPDADDTPARERPDALPAAGADDAAAAPASEAAPRPALPRTWFTSDVTAWVDRPWRDVDLLTFLDPTPVAFDAPGVHYVVFYSRTCEHCETMFHDDLAAQPDLAALVTAVEIPDGRDRLTSPDAWSMPKTSCDLRSLPLGPNWILTPPLALRIEDGQITCAEEGDHASCLGLAP